MYRNAGVGKPHFLIGLCFYEMENMLKSMKSKVISTEKTICVTTS